MVTDEKQTSIKRKPNEHQTNTQTDRTKEQMKKIDLVKIINDPNLLKWEKANLVWYGKDKLLTREAHAIHEQLIKDKINNAEEALTEAKELLKEIGLSTNLTLHVILL